MENMETTPLQGMEPLRRINRSVAGAAMVIAAAAAWGMSGIFVHIILDNCTGTPVSLAFWRDTAACIGLFLFTVVTCPGKLRIKKKDVSWLIGMGFFLGGFHVFYNQSVMMNGAAVTTVLQAAMPAVVTLTAFYLWKEELTRDKILSMILIFIGTVLASGMNFFSTGPVNMAGLSAGFCVPFFYAGWSLCGKNLVSEYGPPACLAVAFGVAALLLLPFQPFTHPPLPVNVSMALAFLGLMTISTFGAFTLFLMGLKYLPAGVAGILVMSEILFAGVYAWLILGERFSPVQLAGTLLVMAGVLWLLYRRNSH
jgi:drug/metabolite transporter (DMT)-like permease